MQTEAGQEIAEIVYRKELERRSTNGCFFWGIGSAPNRLSSQFASDGKDIDVVFSLMKSKPQRRDSSPATTALWTTYFDFQGTERPLPLSALVTSRFHEAKRAHFALMCLSTSPLRLEDHGPFDPTAYRNVGASAGAIGSSQVTALVKRMRENAKRSDYRINFKAKLHCSYWVRLGRPCIITGEGLALIRSTDIHPDTMSDEEWIEVTSYLRGISRPPTNTRKQLF